MKNPTKQQIEFIAELLKHEKRPEIIHLLIRLATAKQQWNEMRCSYAERFWPPFEKRYLRLAKKLPNDIHLSLRTQADPRGPAITFHGVVIRGTSLPPSVMKNLDRASKYA